MNDKATVIGVLASGRGSNLQSIIDNIDTGRIKAKLAVVISDKKDVYALKRAAKHGIATEFVDPKPFRRREDFDTAIIKKLREHGVNLVLLAGYMRIVGVPLLEAFENRIMNIHPALLPAFPGLDVQKKALEHGVRFSGCTVHFVDGGTDTGPIIIQAVVPVMPTDDVERLSERILKLEHRIYPEAVRLYAEGMLRIEAGRVVVTGDPPDDEQFMANPPVKL